MKAPVDLHPDDPAYRAGLSNTLIELRQGRGWGQRRLAEILGVTQSAVGYMETGKSWRLTTVQRWCRALGRRLVLRPDGLSGVADLDAIEAFRPNDPDRADLWVQAALIGELVAARQHLGVTQAILAARLDTSEQAIQQLEACESGLMFATPQRICRALGGELSIYVESATANVWRAAA